MLWWWFIMISWHEMYDDDMTYYDGISCYDDVHVWDAMLHYDWSLADVYIKMMWNSQ